MLKSEIHSGTDYALREKREIGVPFQRVRIIEHVRKNKWKAKWIEPNPGLVDYVESGQLIVPWKERKAFLREEESPSGSGTTIGPSAMRRNPRLRMPSMRSSKT